MWKRFSLGRRRLGVIALFALAIVPVFAQERIPAAGAAQIELLLQEKRSRTAAQQKLDSQLIYNSKSIRGLSSRFRPQALERSRAGLIHVDISAEVSPALLRAIAAMGGRVESSFEQYKSIRAWLPLSAAETLAARGDVHFVGPAVLRVHNQSDMRSRLSRALQKPMTIAGSINNAGPDTNGVRAHGADIVQAAGVTGAGIKIGVLSDGVNSLSSEQAAGRLPNVTVIAGQSGTGDEGTAMLEIVYSMAPGAQLYFATADPSESQFASNIQALAAAGCTVIVDDVTYFDEPVFQDGTVAQAVNAVSAAGVLYFSAAGNSGNLDRSTSGVWEGDFNAGGAAPGITVSGTVHNFGGTNYDVLTGKGVAYLLQWSDPWGGSCNDYDLFILDATGGTVEAASTNTQNCSQNPYEAIADSTQIPTGSKMVIVLVSGAARALHLDTERGALSIGTSGATFGHNAGANTLTVAATDVSTAGGGIFTGGSANPPELFSSDGPRKIFYDPQGNAITPGNLLFGTGGGTTLSKVDFMAADGVSTGVQGFTSFFGTSAAAPHAAAIAALVMSANPSLSASQVKNTLYSASLPVSSYQARTVGSGIVMANLAVSTSAVADLTVSSSHNGSFTQGQTGATYTITVKNSGAGSTSGKVTMVDTLPGSLTATAMTGTGWVCTVATLTCTTSAVESGGASFPAITLTVNVSASAPASVTNSVAVSGGGETNTSNDTGTDPTTITPVVIPTPDLTVSSSHGGSFTQGQTGATYSLTVTNAGTGATSGTVTLVDALPAGLTATAMSGSGWGCNLNTLTCTTTTVEAAGVSFPVITLTVNVAANAAASVTNSVTVSGGGETNTSNDTGTDPTTINPIGGPPDLTISKSHSGSFTQGQTGAVYTIVAANSGASATNGTVTVVDALPAGLTATAMAGSGWGCNLNTLTCTTTTVETAGASFPAITLTVNVSASAAGSVTNTVTVSGGGETNTSNDTALDPTTINPTGTPDLTVAKSHSGSFTQGQTGATYTITVTNSGTAATSGTVTVVDALPAGLTATSMSGSSWGCNLNTLTCTTTAVEAAGASFPVITLTVNVSANATSVINSVTVSGGGETNTANDTATDPTTINSALTPDLTIVKSHSGSFTQGQTGATYSITVTNSGTGPTNGTVSVVDTLPTAMTATGMTGSGWACTLNPLTCTTTAVVAAGGSFPVITLTVNVSANAGASVTNYATVSGGGETITTNDTAYDATTINSAGGTPALTVTSSHAGTFLQGQTGAIYSITVTNSGSAVTSDTVTVRDTLPAGLTATAIRGNGWSCFTPPTLTCFTNAAEIAGASYPPITLTVSVAPNAASGSVVNSVSVSGGGSNAGSVTANDPTVIGSTAPVVTDAFQIRYAENLNVGDSVVNITNSGASAGNICANVYAFDPAEELISCCTCNITPNGLQSLSVLKSLTSNPATPELPTAVVIKLVATSGTCNAATATAANLAPGMLAWGTSLNAQPTVPVSYAVSEAPFQVSTLSAAELSHITSTCSFIQTNSSGFGICRGCAAGGLGAPTSIVQ